MRSDLPLVNDLQINHFGFLSLSSDFKEAVFLQPTESVCCIGYVGCAMNNLILLVTDGKLALTKHSKYFLKKEQFCFPVLY